MSSSSLPSIASPPPDTVKAVLFFWAPWHEASCPGGRMDQALSVLQTSLEDVGFYRVEAEACVELSEKYGVKVVPTVVLVKHGTIVETVEGEDVAAVTKAVQRLAAMESSGVESTTPTQQASRPKEEPLEDRLKRLITSSDVMLFMKGSPSAPRCGFSRQMVELLEEEGISFGSFDILTDEDVRQGLKSYSNWPTYPQLYVKGELVGGLDIVKEMKQEGPLKEQLEITTQDSLEDRLKSLINRHKVMLFMKGLPSAPRCGFSRQMCELLDEQGVSYDSFDILQDEEVRQGLKGYSNWPTYPQLYVNGDLVGGLDICKELAESGELQDLLQG